MRFVRAVQVTVFVGLVGCTQGSNTVTPSASDGGSSGASDGLANAAPAPLSCVDILTCATECADGDDACTDDCLARGSEEGLRYLYELGTFPDGQRKLTIARVMDDGTITTPSELHLPL